MKEFGETKIGRFITWGIVLIALVFTVAIPKNANASGFSVAFTQGQTTAVLVDVTGKHIVAFGGAAETETVKVDEPIVTVEGSAGVLATDASEDVETGAPIVTVHGSAGVLADTATSGDAPSVETVTETETAFVVVEPSVPVQDSVDVVTTDVAAPAVPVETEAGGTVGNPSAVYPDPETGEPVYVTEMFVCGYGSERLAVVSAVGDCDVIFDALPVVTADDGSQVGGGGWIERIPFDVP